MRSDLGNKRRCTDCAAAYYDLNRDPITCPKCGALHKPETRLKSSGREPPKGRTFSKRKPTPVADTPELEPAAGAPALELLDDDLDPAAEATDTDEADEADEADEQEQDEAGDADEAGAHMPGDEGR
jgi:uncharacterized protein (TIGR02300 family)